MRTRLPRRFPTPTLSNAATSRTGLGLPRNFDRDGLASRAHSRTVVALAAHFPLTFRGRLLERFPALTAKHKARKHKCKIDPGSWHHPLRVKAKLSRAQQRSNWERPTEAHHDTHYARTNNKRPIWYEAAKQPPGT